MAKHYLVPDQALFEKCHRLVRELKQDYPFIDYLFQFQILLRYYKEEEKKSKVKAENAAKKKHRKDGYESVTIFSLL